MTAAIAIAHLGRLRKEAEVMQVAIATGQITPAMAAEMAARCDQTARAVLDVVEEPAPVVDHALRDAARSVSQGASRVEPSPGSPDA